MPKMITYDDAFVVSLSRVMTASDEPSCLVHVVVDSLEIDTHTFIAVMDKAFPNNEVNVPRLGRATVDFMAPRCVCKDDSELVLVVARKIHEAWMSFKGEVAEVDVLE